MNNNIKKVIVSANCCKVFLDLEWRVKRLSKVVIVPGSFRGEGSGEAAGSTHSNGHTGLLPCATYYYNYYYISIIVTLFTQRYHEKSGKLGSNCIKVPNSETYNTH